MPTTIPVAPRTVEIRDNPRLLGVSNDDFFAVALFCGIGLLATLTAIICGEQGNWF